MNYFHNIIENFNNNVIYISNKSFKQNKYIKQELRYYISNIINHSIYTTITCIGGESYMFGLISKYCRQITAYTNSKSIYNDTKLNNKMYKKKLDNNLIDYNKFNNIVSSSVLIINLAKLNINILNVINKRFYKKIIIINCHHSEFWKRINILTNYKLISRKQFITNINFITVNVLHYKYEMPEFISLGTTCTTAYQLKKLGLKNNKYPFDWSKSSLNKINSVLQNKFSLFEELKINKLSSNHLYKFKENTSSYILSNIYNISFAHELFNNSNNDINIFQNELLNRINTFKSKKDKYIIFVLFNLQKSNNITTLINSLSQYFNNFKLLYISNSISNSDLLNQNIIYVNINIIYKDWMYSNLDWFDIIYNNI